MSKHTKAPWRIHRPGEYSGSITDYVITGNKSPDPVTRARYLDIARVTAEFGGNPTWEWPTKEECEANARLIASAPELLEGCKMALSYLPARDGKRIPGDPDGDVQLTICNKLKQAIAKAEGGEDE